MQSKEQEREQEREKTKEKEQEKDKEKEKEKNKKKEKEGEKHKGMEKEKKKGESEKDKKGSDGTKGTNAQKENAGSDEHKDAKGTNTTTGSKETDPQKINAGGTETGDAKETKTAAELSNQTNNSSETDADDALAKQVAFEEQLVILGTLQDRSKDVHSRMVTAKDVDDFEEASKQKAALSELKKEIAEAHQKLPDEEQMKKEIAKWEAQIAIISERKDLAVADEDFSEAQKQKNAMKNFEDLLGAAHKAFPERFAAISVTAPASAAQQPLRSGHDAEPGEAASFPPGDRARAGTPPEAKRGRLGERDRAGTLPPEARPHAATQHSTRFIRTSGVPQMTSVATGQDLPPVRTSVEDAKTGTVAAQHMTVFRLVDQASPYNEEQFKGPKQFFRLQGMRAAIDVKNWNMNREDLPMVSNGNCVELVGVTRGRKAPPSDTATGTVVIGLPSAAPEYELHFTSIRTPGTQPASIRIINAVPGLFLPPLVTFTVPEAERIIEPYKTFHLRAELVEISDFISNKDQQGGRKMLTIHDGHGALTIAAWDGWSRSNAEGSTLKQGKTYIWLNLERKVQQGRANPRTSYVNFNMKWFSSVVPDTTAAEMEL